MAGRSVALNELLVSAHCSRPFHDRRILAVVATRLRELVARWCDGSAVGVGGGRWYGPAAHASRALRVPAGPACGRPLTRGALRPWAGKLRAGRWPSPPARARRLMFPARGYPACSRWLIS